ncbi:hypothetical protein GCM10023107_87120 [Actinoplanes octamycinicus]
MLTDAGLALALLLMTLGPWLASYLMTDQKKAQSLIPVGYAWWVLAGLIMAGLLLRRQSPLLALALAGAGVFGHLISQTKFQLLDLAALPLMMYTVAAGARRRRTAVIVLAALMSLTYVSMLINRVQVDEETLRAEKDAKAAKEGQVIERTVIGSTRPAQAPHWWVDPVVDTSQAALEMWLLLVAAYAVGDGMRSRRAHLAAVEQRTADLAREERQRAALAVAAERTRITRELHDVVAHGMSVMVVQAQGAAAALDRHPERTATALQHVIETGRSSLAEMRRLLAANRTVPAELAPLPGIAAVPALVDQLRSAGMRIELHIDGVPEVVPAAVDLSAYRIVQEALTNTLKHAGPAATAQVTLCFEPERLRVEVLDDGPGPGGGAAGPGPDGPGAGGADGHGSGLRGIAERVTMLGGVLETGQRPGGGFRLGALLPVTG